MKRKRRNYTRLLLIIALVVYIITLLTLQKHYADMVTDLTIKVEALEAKTLDTSMEHIEITMKSSIEVCDTESTFKSWMDYRKISDTSSDQYMYQQFALTNANGIRVYEGHLMVAMSSTYGSIGDTFKITFENGSFILAVIGDIKADTECTHPDGSMLEFIVDQDLIPESIKTSGNFNKLYGGVITSIERN